jgi:hypothetical protein
MNSQEKRAFEKIEVELDKMKNSVKESYKKVKTTNNQEKQDQLNSNL